ncbi:peptidase S8/S53 domain-containing protein [Mycena filopes]|nr:peptidase S8/S53 domain-containing protein [Mycena filopes]
MHYHTSILSTLLLLALAPYSHSAPAQRNPGNRKRAQQTTTTAGWGLARIAQSSKLSNIESSGMDRNGLPLRGQNRDWSFPYDDTWGQGVLVYVVDSGVHASHSELTGRVEPGWVLPGLGGVATEDFCNHGTGVASLIAGTTLGLARQATIVPVRISDANRCDRVDSTSTDVAAAVNWVVSDYKSRSNPVAGIINISWQVYQVPEAVDALTSAIAAGIHVIVTAGNDDKNQCFQGPEPQEDWRVQDVGQIVVGMTDYDEIRAQLSDIPGETGSNFGPCVTIFAPGYSMNVASNSGDSAIEIDSGTSFAAPLVAGTIAAYATMHGNLPPAQMRTLLLQNAQANAGIRDLEGSPDIILQAPILSANLQ